MNHLIRKLQSLSSGLTAPDSDGINPDKAEEVGMKIQMQLDGLNAVEASGVTTLNL